MAAAKLCMLFAQHQHAADLQAEVVGGCMSMEGGGGGEGEGGGQECCCSSLKRNSAAVNEGPARLASVQLEWANLQYLRLHA